MDLPKIILFIVLLSIGFYAFVLLYKNKTRENYLFFGFLLLVFVIVYLTTMLDFKISGSAFGIEQTKKEIQTSKEEIKKVANTLVKMSYILADGANRYGGPSPEHLEKIKECQKSIKEYLSNDLDKEIQTTLNELEKRLQEKYGGGKK